MQIPQLRTPFDRTRQAVLYEAGALIFAVPLLSAFTGETSTESCALLVVISIIAMLWTAAWSTAFDWLEARRAARSADRRPFEFRILHAAGLEGGLALLTIPFIALATGAPWPAALAADLCLTAAYAVYAVLFNILYDRIFPISKSIRVDPCLSVAIKNISTTHEKIPHRN